MESLRAAHVITSKANDYATTSLIEIWIDEAERRAWFLFEARDKESSIQRRHCHIPGRRRRKSFERSRIEPSVCVEYPAIPSKKMQILWHGS
jgi:hypothetical protein